MMLTTICLQNEMRQEVKPLPSFNIQCNSLYGNLFGAQALKTGYGNRSTKGYERQALWWKINDNGGVLTWKSEAKKRTSQQPLGIWNNNTEKIQSEFSLFLLKNKPKRKCRSRLARNCCTYFFILMLRWTIKGKFGILEFFKNS